MRKNGKSERDIEVLLRGRHHCIPQNGVDRLLFKTYGKTEQQRKKEIRRVSDRKQPEERIESVQFSGLLAEVRLSIVGQQVTSIITARSAREMQLKPAQVAPALIKASESDDHAGLKA